MFETHVWDPRLRCLTLITKDVDDHCRAADRWPVSGRLGWSHIYSTGQGVALVAAETQSLDCGVVETEVTPASHWRRQEPRRAMAKLIVTEGTEDMVGEAGRVTNRAPLLERRAFMNWKTVLPYGLTLRWVALITVGRWMAAAAAGAVEKKMTLIDMKLLNKGW